MMRRTTLLAAIGLVVASCSGVTEEEYNAALEESAQLEQQVASLEDETAGLESTAQDLEDQLSTAKGRVDVLEDDLSAAEEDLASSVDRYGELADLSAIPNTSAATLIGVFSRGIVRCGVSGGAAIGFSETLGNGSTVGFDADFCRAVAAAVLGDADAVEFVPVSAAERWTAVRFGPVDVMFRTSTWTLTRDAAFGEQVDFGPTTFYDGQKFMGRSDTYTSSSDGGDLNSATVCASQNARTQDVVVAYADKFGVAVEIVTVAALGEAVEAGTCDVFTGDETLLARLRENGIRSGAIDQGDLVIFPSNPLTREPLGPVYIQGDTVWADIVNWVVFTTIIAEEKGITSSNIDSIEWDPEARRLFGGEGEYAVTLGLEPDAFYQVIKQVGSYGEIFSRNLEQLGFIAIGGPNTVSTAGGLLYAPPAR